MNGMTKAMVLLSGGLDSATILWQIRQKYQTYALSFKYHNRNRNEITAAKRLVEETKTEKHLIIDVGFLREICELPELRNNLLVERLNIPHMFLTEIWSSLELLPIFQR